MQTKNQPPKYAADAFDCPHCGAYAHMKWCSVDFASFRNVHDLRSATCSRCQKYSLWACNIVEVAGYKTSGDKGAIFYPRSLASPAPHHDMPQACAPDYQEARSVFSDSPRASAALLRLCIQKLCKELGQPGKNINDDIAALVRGGLPAPIKQALDVVRVTGNNAVHPGEMSEEDTTQLASSLFGLINLVIDNQISQPKRIQELHNLLPTGALEAIEKRDAKALGR